MTRATIAIGLITAVAACGSEPTRTIGGADARADVGGALDVGPVDAGGAPDAGAVACGEFDEAGCLSAGDACVPNDCEGCDGPYFAACLEPGTPPPGPCPRPSCRCEDVTDEARCLERGGYHPEYAYVPEVCGCPPGEPCECYTFEVCASGARATCDGDVLCDLVPPECPGEWTPVVEGSCFPGTCVPIDLCVFKRSATTTRGLPGSQSYPLWTSLVEDAFEPVVRRLLFVGAEADCSRFVYREEM